MILSINNPQHFFMSMGCTQTNARWGVLCEDVPTTPDVRTGDDSPAPSLPPPPPPPPSGAPLAPPPEGCTGCLPAGVPDCYAACAAQSADTPYGQCRYPGSVDPAQCCLCATAMCPSTHPFVYRPSNTFDYCCATGNGRSGQNRIGQNAQEVLDARSQSCEGNQNTRCRTIVNNRATNPCIDYAPPPPPAAPPPPPSAPPALPPGATLQREVRAAPSRRQHLLRRPPPLLPHTPPHCR